jgi:hypothetical protein
MVHGVGGCCGFGSSFLSDEEALTNAEEAVVVEDIAALFCTYGS